MITIIQWKTHKESYDQIWIDQWESTYLKLSVRLLLAGEDEAALLLTNDIVDALGLESLPPSWPSET